MSVVVDASVLAAFVLPDEDGEAATAMLEASLANGLQAPSHLPAEIGNVILQALRRGRLSAEQAAMAREMVADLGIELDTPAFGARWEEAAFLASRYGLTLYDAAYLEHAIHLGAALATFDKALIRAAEAEGVAFST